MNKKECEAEVCEKMILTQGLFLSLLRDIAMPKSLRCSRSEEIKYSNMKSVLLFHDIVNSKCPLDKSSLSAYNGMSKKYGSNSFNSAVSAFLSCNRKLSSVLYQGYGDLIDELSKCSVESIYQTCLDKTRKLESVWFCNDIVKLEEFVSTVLYIIQNDDTIDGKSVFYINGKDNPISKEDLSDSLLDNPVRVSFPEFVLGVWLFLLIRNTDNKEGKKTFTFLFSKEEENKNYSNRYNGRLRGEYKRPIEIVLKNQGEQESPENQEIPVNQEIPQNREVLEKSSCLPINSFREETMVIAKELEYPYCFFCEEWRGSEEDGIKGYPRWCGFQKKEKYPNDEACEYFRPHHYRISLKKPMEQILRFLRRGML